MSNGIEHIDYALHRALINKCIPIVARRALEKRKDNRTYNIYRLLHVTNNEVQMCRILADLLDPYGEHGAGDRYLRLFLEKVLKVPVNDELMQDVSVYKEYLITNDRRIDIVIASRKMFIPIEVKVNAGDQKSQCYDYYQFAKSRVKDTVVVYLTKDGHHPSDYSITGTNGEKLKDEFIRCLSFSVDILEWLNELKNLASDEMKIMIDQYIGAINDFLLKDEERYKMELSDALIESEENLRAAIEIAKSINNAKISLIKKLFVEFEKQMEPILNKYSLEAETTSEWFHYKYEADGFYSQSESSCPGVNYVVKSVKIGELSLWLRIEIENKLFAALCMFDYNAKSDPRYAIGNQHDKITDEQWDSLKKLIVLPETQENGNWMLIRKYLPTGSSSIVDRIDTVPDFKAMNDAAIELTDDKKREAFVARCIKTIEDTLLALIK